MALAGSGAPNSTAAVPTTALYPSGIPPSLRNVKPSSFSTAAAAAAAATTKTQSMDIPKSRHGHAHGKSAVANVNIGGLPTPPNSVSPTLYPLSQERETYHRKAGAAALANTAAGVTAHDGGLRHSGNEHAIEHGNANVNVNANANGSKHQLSFSPTSQRDIDSDLDLQEAVDHAHAQNQPLYHNRQQHQHLHHQQQLLSEITPESLAAYHIPEILLNEGPLAIRHIIARLNQKIPGFSRIPAARARRVVAAALEEGALEKNRQNQFKESMFKKAGSGHWDASSAAAAAAASRGSAVDRTQMNIVSPGSSSSSFASSMLTEHPQGRHVRSSSMTTMAESATTAFSYSETPEVSGLKDRCNAMSHEADKMSFGYGYDDISMDDDDDDDDRCDRGSVVGNNDDDDDDLDMDWNEADDMTDEEDWAQIGADALRARSYGLSPPTHMMTSASGPDSRTMAMGINGQSGIVPLRAQQAIAQYQSANRNGLPNGNRRFNQHGAVPMAAGRADGGYSFGVTALAKSMPARGPGPMPISMLKLKPEEKKQLAGSGPEERAAIEALLRLGSTPV
ncbi:hypothetical protein KEM56_000709 [Ascosphaera pollenicola]|nr:hypothetical protein KEM56_000709 [Ascosphaera pollenicola]